VNELDRLFDPKQFAVAFGAAIGESSSVVRTCGKNATAHSEGDAAIVGTGLSRGGDQKVVHNVLLRRKQV
jgi:hypothetical protein